MEILLTRTHRFMGHVDGELSTTNGKICDTVENWNYSLSPGAYKVRLLKCRFRSRKMPCIIVTTDYQTPCDSCQRPGYVGINTSPHYDGAGSSIICPQICPGNGMHNRHDGSIIVGTRILSGCLINPKAAFSSLYDLIRKSAERGHSITLTIIEKITRY